MIIKIFDYMTQKTGSPIDGIIIGKWEYGHILNWKDEERIEKLYKEYGEKNLEYLEMKKKKENSNFYIIKNNKIKDIEAFSKAFVKIKKKKKNIKKIKELQGMLVFL